MNWRQLTTVGAVVLVAGCSQPVPQELTPDLHLITPWSVEYTPTPPPNVTEIAARTENLTKALAHIGLAPYDIIAIRKSDGGEVPPTGLMWAGPARYLTFPAKEELLFMYNLSTAIQMIDDRNRAFEKANISYRININEIKIRMPFLYAQYNATYNIFRYAEGGWGPAVPYEFDPKKPSPINLSAIQMGRWGGWSPLAI